MRFLILSLLATAFLGFNHHSILQISSAWAGTISLQMKASVEVGPEIFKTNIEFSNLGDEAAQEVTVTTWLGRKPYRLKDQGTIAPNRNLKIDFQETQHPFQEEGEYYLPLQVVYHDTLGSRFILPYVLRFVNQTAHSPGLKATVAPVVLPRDIHVKVTLKNTGTASKQIRFRNVMAMNINMTIPPSSTVLGPGEEQTWHLKVKHGNLWPNTYTSYLIAEYSNQNIHYTLPIPIPMKVEPATDFFSGWFTQANLTIAIVILIAVALMGGYGPLAFRKLWPKHS